VHKHAKRALLFIAVALIACFGARPFASGWNDGSRLASAESLVDRGTWSIDDSIFVKPLPRDNMNPYSLTIESSPVETGTMDKVFVHGHFYSDKPPVASLYLAALYWMAKQQTGLSARDNPHAFIKLLTLGSSGVAYLIAVLCIFLLGLRSGLTEEKSVFATLSFALATLAPVYSRQINNHILQLAVFGLIFLVATNKKTTREAWMRATQIGLLAGLGYTLDLGIGPVLVLSTLIYTALQTRRFSPVLITAIAMLPFIALHHWLNFKIGGTWRPINANPEFFQYPGSHFDADTMTGLWSRHGISGFFDFLLYAVLMMVGVHGFLLHNLPLLAGRKLGSLKSALISDPELAYCALLIFGSWAVYAAGSKNNGGLCCSIRWFVPLLIPSYWLLIRSLARAPETFKQLQVFTIFGFALTIAMFWVGPWGEPSRWIYWPLVGAALVAFYGMRAQANAALSSSESR
jgi:hypothetical protein